MQNRCNIWLYILGVYLNSFQGFLSISGTPAEFQQLWWRGEQTCSFLLRSGFVWWYHTYCIYVGFRFFYFLAVSVFFLFLAQRASHASSSLRKAWCQTDTTYSKDHLENAFSEALVDFRARYVPCTNSVCARLLDSASYPS